ncbi:MAG TPA: sigma-70 family RNA polymerase sigma factor [Gemmataceae bacterium]|nr:sigma-70 family RNA polymerase sigma factor [Gemmataceae bacterium]
MSSNDLAAGIRRLRGKMAAQCRNDESDEQLLHAFTTRRDQDAFAVLVRRHGPMVLNVCRRVLGHEQDAEDAFQATFLLLTQSGAGLRKQTALAGFLHGAAYRIALTAKRAAARRRKHENQAPAHLPSDPADELSWREARALLDEEIGRLPEKYRTVFVLFHLEELSREETARRLGLKDATVAKRLAEARKRLASRLRRRGVELTAVLAASMLAAQPASALPSLLTATTIKAALATAAGEGLAGVVSASVAELVKGTTAAVMMSKAKIATALLLTATLLAGAGAWTCRILTTPQSAQTQEEPSAPSRKSAARNEKLQQEKEKDVVVSGRVVDPDGKPVRGTKILFLYPSVQDIPKKIWATSADDGRFAFTAPGGLVRSRYREKPWKDTHVLAAAEGYGFAAVRLGKPGAEELALRLVKDDVPIQGRIVDLQGRPVVGARVGIYGSLYAPEKGDLTAWFAALKNAKRDQNLVWYAPLTDLSSPAFEMLFPPVTTGADGRFCIRGIGRERIAALRIEGPAIATETIHVMTRPSETIRLSEDKYYPITAKITVFGPAFDLAAAPARPIVGVVRDKDTGKPLPGITIESETIAHRYRFGLIRTTTDKNGRYRLIGFPKSDGNKIAAKTNELPYFAAVKTAANPWVWGRSRSISP